MPGIEKFRNRDVALQKFNEILDILLLGGIYSEAIQPEDISFGTMFLDGYVKQHGGGSEAISNFHNSIRTKTVGIGNAIQLLEPRTILNTDIQSAYKKGQGSIVLITLPFTDLIGSKLRPVTFADFHAGGTFE